MSKIPISKDQLQESKEANKLTLTELEKTESISLLTSFLNKTKKMTNSLDQRVRK